jgi:hypothetical protein
MGTGFLRSWYRPESRSSITVLDISVLESGVDCVLDSFIIRPLVMSRRSLLR